jgi:hypothetical protein
LPSRERPESALCGRWLTMRRMSEDAPLQPSPEDPSQDFSGREAVIPFRGIANSFQQP